MKASSAERLISPGLPPLNQAQHVPGAIYTSTEIFERDKQLIFMRDWVCTIREEEIGRPGDYVAIRLMGEPFVLCRDHERRINAFVNVCAHRGVEVASGTGNTREFSCPYHGWLYSLEGRLVSAPYMKEAQDFDMKTCRLSPLSVAVWEGWVFVSFAADPEPFDSVIAEFDDAFRFLQQIKCRTADKLVVELKCNWKLVNENLMDTYHFKTRHASSFGKFLNAKQFDYRLMSGGSIAAFYSGRPAVPGGKSLFGPMPWIGEGHDDLSCMGYFPPNFHLFGRCDAIIPYIVWPLTPDRTRIDIHLLFPTEHFAAADFREKVRVYHEFQEQVVHEDSAMVEGMQSNLGSLNFRPGRMSRHELTVHHIINAYLARVFG